MFNKENLVFFLKVYQKGTTIGEPRNDTHEFQSNCIETNPKPLIPVSCERRRLSGVIIHIQEKSESTGNI